MAIKIDIKSGKGDRVKTVSIEVENNASVHDLKEKYSKAVKKDIHRISLKANIGEKVLRLDDDSKKVADYELGPSPTLEMKDLGAQIGYRNVFLLEYFGPMLFVFLYYLRPSFLYGADASKPYNWVALLGVACWIVHFMKREFETLFVHKFSRPTMPLSNLFKNCAYYWTFGAVIGYPLCHPGYVAPTSEFMIYLGFGIFAVSELGNLICHLMLSNMRSGDGSKDRQIPKGFLFEYVACPNYTFEVLSWVGFSIMTQIPFAYLFTLIGFLQMADWAIKKHKGYKKTYDKEYTKLRRKAIIPFVI